MTAPAFAISIPQHVPDGAFDPGALRDYLGRAEELGFVGAWVSEQIFGDLPHIGPIETLTYAAACTERIRLGCAVLVTPLYGPVHLAKSLASLDQLSRGRLDVGVGAGGGFRAFPAFGVDGASFVARFTEGLALMRALWTEPRVDFPGRFWQVSGATMEPKPFQKPHPPIWFGANHPAALARGVRLGDGFFGAGSTTTARFAEQVGIVRSALAGQGREGPFPIAKRVYIAVDDDADRGKERITAALDALYGPFGLTGLTAVAVYGPPADCAAGLREVVDAGAEMILLNPLDDDAAQMERLAGDVVPLVR